MKATGIVRRIDDLGRVVIPKEIRRTMRIREGDPLEIYTSNDGEVIFKKYSPINELADGAIQVAEVINKLGDASVVVFDRDHVVAVAGVKKKEFSERRVSPSLDDLMENRKSYLYNSASDNKVLPIEGVEKHAIAIFPILSNGDVTGAVAFLANEAEDTVKDNQAILAQSAAMFLGKQIEE